MVSKNKLNIQAWSKYSQEDISSFGEEGDDSRKYLLNPILFQLIGDPTGKEILDAGAGTGYLSRLLAKRGAKVTALEPSDSLFQYSTEQEKENRLGIHFIQEDLSEFRPTNSFDIVIANMVLMDVYEYQLAMKNCLSALKDSGVFIFSISHPCFPGSDNDWKIYKAVVVTQYFEESEETHQYGKSWRRPIQDYLKVLFDEGWAVTSFVEPRPDASLVEQNNNWERNYIVPQFLVVKAEKL